MLLFHHVFIAQQIARKHMPYLIFFLAMKDFFVCFRSEANFFELEKMFQFLSDFILYQDGWGNLNITFSEVSLSSWHHAKFSKQRWKISFNAKGQLCSLQ